MPNGVFSGVKLTDSTTTMQAGIVALLRRKINTLPNSQAPQLRHELIYVDMEGNELSKNQKIILEQLNAIHLQPRYVATPIECGDSQAIQQLSNALKTWISNQAITSELQEDGTIKQTMGKAALDSLNKLKSGSADAINELKNEGNIAQHYTTDNFELVTWILIS